jgi:hypothetical protein
MIDDDDDFFSADDDDEMPEAQRTLGLIVPPRALTPQENNGVDELAEREAEYRRNGRPPVIFEEEDY